MSIIIEPIPFSQTNYAWLLYDVVTKKAIVVDPGDFSPVARSIEENGLVLQSVLVTHHHSDHTGGLHQLRETYPCQVIAPLLEREKIPDATVYVQDHEKIDLGCDVVSVMATPGHTAGSVCYYFPALKAVFTGDTLFSLGCGRLFEGSPEQMYHSLHRIAALPEEVSVYPAHEYTEANGLFALTLYPDNVDLRNRVMQVQALRKNGQPTLPVLLSVEKRTNPFLLAQTVGEFTRFRMAKDHFM